MVAPSVNVFRALGPQLLCLAMLFAAACSSTASTPAGGSAVGGATDGEGGGQPKVQRLVFAQVPIESESNEIRVLAGQTFLQIRPVYEYLIGVDAENGKYTPQLATEWKLEPDGLSFRFKLRQGVQFHNGYGEFTSKDLEEPWRQRTRTDFVTTLAGYWRDTLSGIEKVGDYEAVYHLKRPDGNYLLTMSEQRGSMEMFSKKNFDEAGQPTIQNPMLAGTAPYQYLDRRQGEYLRFKRAPYKHWRVTPDFEEIEFRFIKEPSSRLAAFITGEAQIATLPEDLLAVAEKGGGRIINGRAAGLRTFVPLYCCYLKDPKDPSKGPLWPDSPLQDVRVRKALAKAINRDALNKAYFGGKGTPMLLPHHHPTRPGWNPDWEKRAQEAYGYDPEAAKKLLAEAGYGPGKPVVTNMLIAPAAGYSGGEDVEEAIATQWRAIGVDAKLVTMDSGERDKLLRGLQLSNHAIVDATGSDMWTGTTNGGSTLGVRGRGVELADLDKVLAEMGNTLDEKKQDELWRKAGDIMFDQYQSLPLFWLPTQVVVRKDVVAGYSFPGSITGSWTHLYTIKAVK